MEAFSRALEHSRVFSITTELATFDSLYLFSCFKNWASVYNLCSPSRTIESEVETVSNTIKRCDSSPRAWIYSFCRVANEAIDRLAADLYRVKLDHMDIEEIKRARETDDPRIHVSTQEISENISHSFASFCTILRSTSSKSSVEARGIASLTIDDVDSIDRMHKKEQDNMQAQSNLSKLIRKLNITPITFWFMIYVIGHMTPAEAQQDMMQYLFHIAGTEMIFTEETFIALEQWKTSEEQVNMAGNLNSESMSFLFMYHHRA